MSHSHAMFRRTRDECQSATPSNCRHPLAPESAGTAELPRRTFCPFGRELSSPQTVSRRRTPQCPRGVERRERTADDDAHDDPEACSTALRPPASRSRPRQRGHDRRHGSRDPSLDGPTEIEHVLDNRIGGRAGLNPRTLVPEYRVPFYCVPPKSACRNGDG
jgi:hypothetical protein